MNKILLSIENSISEEDLAKYGKDWTDFWEANPSIIFFPRNTIEVQTIVLEAYREGISIVPSGGRTGLSGGAVANNQEWVISLEKMDKVLGFDKGQPSVSVEAGMITEALQVFAEEQGLYYPVDFASKGSSQIGGNIATNAGGVKVVRWGLTRDQILGLKVVTGKGEILELNNGLIKNATGFDLRHLFIGSEGTLGIITEACVKLFPARKPVFVLFLAIEEISKAMDILHVFRKEHTINAFEFLSDKALGLVLDAHPLQAPFKEKSPFYILIEIEQSGAAQAEQLAETLEYFYEKEGIQNDLFGQDQTEIDNIWAYRERISESASPFTPYKNDISVKPSDIPAFLAEAEILIGEKYPDFEVLWYGHIADGNIHINILKPQALDREAFRLDCNAVSIELFQLVQKYQGSISAEHGVGLLKKDYLHYSKSEAEIAYMKGIKAVFDPKNIMNPGKLFRSFQSLFAFYLSGLLSHHAADIIW